jgi:hypothetical protein
MAMFCRDINGYNSPQNTFMATSLGLTIFDFAVMLIESLKKDKATSKPSDAQQVKPDIIKRYRESDKKENPWENKEK